MRFSGTERIGKVDAPDSTGNFKTQNFLFSPSTLAWLAKIAVLYDKYRFTKLNIRYVNFCSTATSGEVNLAFDFDPKDPAPANMVQAANMAVYRSTSAFRNVTLPVPVKAPSNFVWRYCRDDNVGETRIVDTGKLHVSTEGFASAASPGALYVDYEVEFADKNANF
jgi:hypothetical protein